MSLVTKINNEFITVYSAKIDSQHWINLIDKIDSNCYSFEKVERRPHETMELPNYFSSTDSIEAIELRNLFFSVLSLGMNDYSKKINLVNAEPYQPFLAVSKLKPYRPMATHQDSKKENSNGFVCMLYINDDYEGGEISFPNRDYKYKPAIGDFAFYQMNEHHSVEYVKSGIRYSMGCGFNSPIEEAVNG
jgi:hypothetical protein